MKKPHIAIVLSAILASAPTYAVDFSAEYKNQSNQKATATEKMEKLKKDATKLICNYNKGFGKEVYVLNDVIYKEQFDNVPVMKKVATFKKDSAEWKEQYGEGSSSYFVYWQLKKESNSVYRIYMKALNLPVDRYDCVVQ